MTKNRNCQSGEESLLHPKDLFAPLWLRFKGQKQKAGTYVPAAILFFLNPLTFNSLLH